MLGYFFGPSYSSVPEVPSRSPRPSEALLITLFGDLRLIKHKWPILGRAPDWDSDRWPMSTFCRTFNGRPYEVTYDPNNFSRDISQVEVSPDRCKELPRDTLAGAGAVEIKLTRLLTDG